MRGRGLFRERRSPDWRSLLRARRYGAVLLYIPAYLLCFGLLERFPQAEFHLIRCPLDRLIPTIPAFFLPYAFWWFFFPASIFYFYFFEKKKDFLKLCFLIFTGYTVCLLCYVLYPNGIDIREPLPGRDLCSRAILLLRRIDTPQHVCPSMHVSSTAAICFSVRDLRHVPARQREAVYLSGILIVLSTLFIKQHSIVDVVWGVLLSLLLDLLWEGFLEKKIH